MKYMILVYSSQQGYDSLVGADGVYPVAAIDEFLATFTGGLAESGELVDTQGLLAPVLARSIQLRDGAPVVTDGPFAETEEVIAGYWLVDCASFDRATEIALQLTTAPGGLADRGVVIRPVMGGENDTDDI